MVLRIRKSLGASVYCMLAIGSKLRYSLKSQALTEPYR